MRAFGETTATRPARSAARARLNAVTSGGSPGVVVTAIVLPSARMRISPPPAARPRPSPRATRWDGGGSTTRTSSERGSPKVRPHWPQIADAAASSLRRAATAPTSVPPTAGRPPGVTRMTNGRTMARRRPMGPTGDERGPSTRIICAFRPPLRNTTAPPTSALIERPSPRGWSRSTSSMTKRSGALAQHRSPCAARRTRDGREPDLRERVEPHAERGQGLGADRAIGIEWPAPPSGADTTRRSASGSS